MSNKECGDYLSKKRLPQYLKRTKLAMNIKRQLLFWRISLICLAVELVGSLVELGFSVGMEDF